MDILFTPLKIIEGKNGDVFHAMKSSSPGYFGFGEAYFSTVTFGETKNWRKHLRMTCNLIVPVGCIQCNIVNSTASKSAGKLIIETFQLSRENYGRLTIPPGYWFNIKGKEPGLNLLLNISDQEHDSNEALTLPFSITNYLDFQ